MDPESTQLFNDRLAQWVAKQGFWFQIRYSMAGGGSSVLAFHLLRILLRLFIFLAIASVVIFVILLKRPEQVSFKKELRNNILEALDGDTAVMRSFSRSQNKASIRHFALIGKPTSFIESCEASGISFRMGLLDGITPVWNANQIQVERLSLNVRAGAETPEEASAIGNSISKSFSGLKFQMLEAVNTRIAWGYSSRTMGSISKSHMFAIKEGADWRLKFNSGVLSQNWLRNLNIVELSMVVNNEGIIINQGEFTVGTPVTRRVGIEDKISVGKVKFQNVKIAGGTRPLYSGTIILENVPLDQITQDTYSSYIEGTVSGELKISGSTNSTEGVAFTGRLTLNENDSISMRNRLPLLNSLSILSPSGTYRKLKFTDGYFSLQTSGGALTLSDINLSAPGQMELSGAFTVRPPKRAEIEDMLNRGDISKDAALAAASVNLLLSDETSSKANDEMTLQKAVKLAKADRQENEAGFKDDVIDMGTPFHAESFQIDQQASLGQKLAITSIFEGNVQVKLPVAAFPKESSFLTRIPKTADGTILLLDCPLLGSLSEITQKQAEDLLLLEKNTPAENTDKGK